MSVLAKSALQGPDVACAGDCDDVEIQTFGRICCRHEHDLAKKPAASVVVALGREHLQVLVVQAAACGRFAFIGRLYDRYIGNGIAQQPDQRAYPQRRVEQQHALIRLGADLP
jgi:hypothetical protein